MWYIIQNPRGCIKILTERWYELYCKRGGFIQSREQQPHHFGENLRTLSQTALKVYTQSYFEIPGNGFYKTT